MGSLTELKNKGSETRFNEHPGIECEAKIVVIPAIPGDSLLATAVSLHGAFAQSQFPGYSAISRKVKEKVPAAALRTMYGWIDTEGGVHEVITLVESQEDQITYSVKRKGDSVERAGTAGAMSRPEEKLNLTARPDVPTMLEEEKKRTGKDLLQLPQFRKHKTTFKVKEERSGRILEVSLDLTYLEDRDELPLCQIEVEYLETCKTNGADIVSNIPLEQSCDDLRNMLLLTSIEGVTLSATDLSKVQWLYVHMRENSTQQTP